MDDLIGTVVASVAGVIAFIWKHRVSRPANGLRLARELLDSKDTQLREAKSDLEQVQDKNVFLTKQNEHLRGDLAAARGLVDGMQDMLERRHKRDEA